MDNYPDEEPLPNGVQHGELVRFLTQSREMRQTAKSSLKQAMYAGGGAFAGAFLLGPVGGLVGGVAGSVAGYYTSGDYDGAVLSVTKLEGRRREQLMREVCQVLTLAGASASQFANAEEFQDTLYRLAERDSVRDGIWRACSEAIRE
eukprot:CAMPEP_0194029096 /NCGR_PEP_ID=MMETSP0009_2-20130614/2943_1 /TAXON_ID=210454 /ORGANISM="Grammatophora oceanica, Strain CCMP 410" /LENGTH=146 /DNA_ID=CAMNT_0038668691 /DNA_START=56 /DNA_END=496 /DNA_ORIENTATION=+